MTGQDDELEQIRARHEACCYTVTKTEWQERAAFDAHTDRATLLRLLDAARAELANVREAAKVFVELAEGIHPDTDNDAWLDVSAGSLRRLAAALKGSGHDETRD